MEQGVLFAREMNLSNVIFESDLPSPQWWYNGTSDPRHSAREVFFFLPLFPTREKGLQQGCP